MSMLPATPQTPSRGAVLKIGLVLFLALVLRLQGIFWDQGHHLHPDERFLLMVTAEMSTPESLGEYLDPARSPLNPPNIGYPAFVYGTFPLTLLHTAGEILHRHSYDGLLLPGRGLSILADLATLGFLWGIALLLLPGPPPLKEQGALFGALFYAVGVLPIQLSHFFAADTFQNACTWGALFFLLLSRSRGLSWGAVLTAGILGGLSVACKLTGGAVLPLGLFLLLLPQKSTSWKTRTGGALLFCLAAWIALRLGSPSYFASAQLWDPHLSPVFLSHFKQMLHSHSGNGWFPPSLQWYGTSPLHMVRQLLFWGFGLPLGIWCTGGTLLLAAQLLRKRLRVPLGPETLLLLLWGGALLFYHSMQFTKYMRYILVLYPLLALGGGYGFALLREKLRHSSARLLVPLLLLLFLVWPGAFLNIFAREHSRVAASKWMLAHIPPNSPITFEIWDDSLPLGIRDIPWTEPEFLGLPVFDNDTSPRKWKKMREQLEKAEYLVLSSGRGYQSIEKASEKYPRMRSFYEKLFREELPFKKIRTFASFPSLPLGFTEWTVDDREAEESFTVYDHPVVHIFQKTGPLPAELY